MEISLVRNYSESRLWPIFQVLCGSIFMVLAARISLNLPFTPVPLTFQTFAVLLLAMVLGGKKASAAIILYLAQASCGLPVLGGAAMTNPMWIISPTAGYLLGFALAAYSTGMLLEYKKNAFFSVLLGLVCIYLPGILWLSTYIGCEQAFKCGVLCFMPLETVKFLSLITINYARKNNYG